jgi:hypothetical protein
MNVLLSLAQLDTGSFKVIPRLAHIPAAFGAYRPLVSPAQEHVQGTEWWTDYQPVSYNLISKRGTREQYGTMIQTCHAAGVKVIAG